VLRKKDYPTELFIGDNVWDIKFVRKPLENDPYCYGLCDPGELTISIRLGQSPEERLKTFLHELLHAVEYEYKIEIPHSLIARLEDPFARFLIDNYLGGSEQQWKSERKRCS
jgi:hypothetical protein